MLGTMSGQWKQPVAFKPPSELNHSLEHKTKTHRGRDPDINNNND